jgi:thiamine biosynthesis lipoprotein
MNHAKETQIIMGMPITVEVVGTTKQEDIERVFGYFRGVDEIFSTYKNESEISKINLKELSLDEASFPVREIFRLSEKTKEETKGYFNIWNGKIFDPSGLVKGWAILNAAGILINSGYENFYVEAGGDVQTYGKNGADEYWKVGIKNPFNQEEIIKVVKLSGQGIATSGNYIRGQHIYNPVDDKPISDIVSLTVIGPNVYEADRFATAAFAMGKDGINFIERLDGLEGYIIDKDGMATMTSGFEKYV